MCKYEKKKCKSAPPKEKKAEKKKEKDTWCDVWVKKLLIPTG